MAGQTALIRRAGEGAGAPWRPGLPPRPAQLMRSLLAYRLAQLKASQVVR